MSIEEIHKCLERLRSELNKLEGDDVLIKEQVNGLISAVEHRLEHPDDSTHRKTLNQNTHSFIKQFETEHPRMTGILNQIMMTLSKLGI